MSILKSVLKGVTGNLLGDVLGGMKGISDVEMKEGSKDYQNRNNSKVRYEQENVFTSKEFENIDNVSDSTTKSDIINEPEWNKNSIEQQTTTWGPNGPTISLRIKNKYKTSPNIGNSTDLFDTGDLLFKVPNWGYQDYIYERTSWQKGLDSVTGDPGWFYFKVFFDFSNPHGLLGALVKEATDTGLESKYPSEIIGNCARRYLEANDNHYKNGSHFYERSIALKKFGTILSYISSKAPWFFNSVSGLDKIAAVDFTSPMKDNSIELGFKPDAIDMRVSSLFDLYRYAAFDFINMKEVLPENLRQFDMTVILFQTPLKYYHTGMQTMKRGTFQYKTLNAENSDDRLSYKMYSFKGCEFDRQSLGALLPTDMSNEEPFQLGNAKIKINYKRVYQHTLNEWGRFLIGDDGVYYDNNAGVSKRIRAIMDAKENPLYSNKNAEIFKALVDASEAKIQYAMKTVDPSSLLGNLYLDMPNLNKSYYKNKIQSWKKGTKSVKTTTTQSRTTKDTTLSKIKKSAKKLGNLYGGATNVKSAEYQEKIKTWKQGTNSVNSKPQSNQQPKAFDDLRKTQKKANTTATKQTEMTTSQRRERNDKIQTANQKAAAKTTTTKKATAPGKTATSKSVQNTKVATTKKATAAGKTTKSKSVQNTKVATTKKATAAGKTTKSKSVQNIKVATTKKATAAGKTTKSKSVQNTKAIKVTKITPGKRTSSKR